MGALPQRSFMTQPQVPFYPACPHAFMGIIQKAPRFCVGVKHPSTTPIHSHSPYGSIETPPLRARKTARRTESNEKRSKASAAHEIDFISGSYNSQNGRKRRKEELKLEFLASTSHTLSLMN